MRVYAIFQQAVYRHDCFGIYDDPQRACDEAKRLAQEDVDCHHSYDVVPFELNSTLRWDREPERFCARYAVEEEPIARYRKEKSA